MVNELKQLWDTYDSYSGETFRLKGALLWTINDFLAYSNLFGWGTKWKMACPHCNIDKCSYYLKRSRKLCYTGHRCFLNIDHKFRCNRKSFDGNTEMRPAPKTRSGSQLLDQMQGLDVTLGNALCPSKVRGNEVIRLCLGRRRVFFFQLPYWEHLLIRHNLDVMHVEENFSDSLIGTLLNIEGKTKDTLQSHLDLKDL